jgi:hypothetical protein
MVSYYPQVSEWIYLGDTAINMAQVASIEFGWSGDETFAIVRLSSYHAVDDMEERNKTWFKVKQADLVRALRQYVEGLSAPGFAHDGYPRERASRSTDG